MDRARWLSRLKAAHVQEQEEERAAVREPRRGGVADQFNVRD